MSDNMDWARLKRRELRYGGYEAQKFRRGDVIALSGDAYDRTRHLLPGRSVGVVVGSYQDQYGHPNWWREDGDGNPHPKDWKSGPQTYTVAFEGNTISWFDEKDLMLIERDD